MLRDFRSISFLPAFAGAGTPLAQKLRAVGGPIEVRGGLVQLVLTVLRGLPVRSSNAATSGSERGRKVCAASKA